MCDSGNIWSECGRSRVLIHPGPCHTKDLKMVLTAPLCNTPRKEIKGDIEA